MIKPLNCTERCQKFIKIHQNLPKFINIYQNLSKFIKIFIAGFDLINKPQNFLEILGHERKELKKTCLFFGFSLDD